MGRDKTSISDEMRVAVITMEGANTETIKNQKETKGYILGLFIWN